MNRGVYAALKLGVVLVALMVIMGGDEWTPTTMAVTWLFVLLHLMAMAMEWIKDVLPDGIWDQWLLCDCGVVAQLRRTLWLGFWSCTVAPILLFFVWGYLSGWLVLGFAWQGMASFVVLPLLWVMCVAMGLLMRGLLQLPLLLVLVMPWLIPLLLILVTMADPMLGMTQRIGLLSMLLGMNIVAWVIVPRVVAALYSTHTLTVIGHDDES